MAGINFKGIFAATKNVIASPFVKKTTKVDLSIRRTTSAQEVARTITQNPLTSAGLALTGLALGEGVRRAAPPVARGARGAYDWGHNKIWPKTVEQVKVTVEA